MKAFADNKINVSQKLKFVLGRVEKCCGKRRKCWLPAFSSFPTIFSKGFSLRVVQSGLRHKEFNPLPDIPEFQGS